MERLIRNAQNSGDIDESIDAAEAARACVAMMDGIGIQTLRSGFPLSPEMQRAIIDKWIVNWLKPKRPLSSDVQVLQLSPQAKGQVKPARAKAKNAKAK